MKTIRKNLLLLAFAAGALFVIGNNVMASPQAEKITSGENTATCYSTFMDPGLLQRGFNIFRCGTCETVSASAFFDPGICSFMKM